MDNYLLIDNDSRVQSSSNRMIAFKTESLAGKGLQHLQL